MRKLATALDCDLRIELKPTRKAVVRPDRNAAVKQLGRLFWERELTPDDLRAYPVWVMERVLDYGNLKDVHLLQRLMGRRRFLETVSRVTRLSPKTRALWEQILKKEGIPCTKKYSRPTAWNC